MRLSDQIYAENVALSRRKLIAGALLSSIGSMGYYSAYAFVIWRTLEGALTVGMLTFLAGAIQQASSNIEQIFSTFAGIGDQALFLTDLLAFFGMRPTVRNFRPKRVAGTATDYARPQISKSAVSVSGKYARRVLDNA